MCFETVRTYCCLCHTAPFNWTGRRGEFDKKKLTMLWRALQPSYPHSHVTGIRLISCSCSVTFFLLFHSIFSPSSFSCFFFLSLHLTQYIQFLTFSKFLWHSIFLSSDSPLRPFILFCDVLAANSSDLLLLVLLQERLGLIWVPHSAAELCLVCRSEHEEAGRRRTSMLRTALCKKQKELIDL